MHDSFNCVACQRLCTTGLAALRSPCSRLQVLCLPSVASPFAEASVHRTLAFSRLTHPRTTASFDSGHPWPSPCGSPTAVQI